uniref:Uncharacterized protein n=1 Tax=Biomphalaria glabrata TaxID=6526 RepID=A0A2C9LQC9_BIOGL
MTALGFQAIGGLEIIESGLNDLRRSQLMIIPEFKYMFGAIQKHHSDLKFAHITGKAKDLLDQAVLDTKFYNILIKMLCEVKQRRTGEQRAGLRQVYTWYQANKHVLYCGPRFGKDFMREQAKEILHKSMSTKSKKRTVSARERLAGNRNFSEHLSLENADTNTVKENLDPQNSTMGQKDVNIVTVQDIFNNDAHPSDVNKNMEETQVTFKDDSSYTSSEPKVARPKSAISVTISHLNEKVKVSSYWQNNRIERERVREAERAREKEKEEADRRERERVREAETRSTRSASSFSFSLAQKVGVGQNSLNRRLRVRIGGTGLYPTVMVEEMRTSGGEEESIFPVVLWVLQDNTELCLLRPTRQHRAVFAGAQQTQLCVVLCLWSSRPSSKASQQPSYQSVNNLLSSRDRTLWLVHGSSYTSATCTAVFERWSALSWPTTP